MKNLKLLLALIFITFSSFATSNEGHGCKVTKSENIEGFLTKSLSSEEILENWKCIFAEQNLNKDNNKTNNTYENLFPIVDDKTYEIEGKIRYYGFIPKKYKYTVKLDARQNRIEIILNINMYLSKQLAKRTEICNEDESIISAKYSLRTITRIKKICVYEEGRVQYKPLVTLWEEIDSKLKEAEDLWNKSAPKNIKFTFNRVNSNDKSHYKIKIADKFGALYDTFLYYGFGADVFAHEVGHMLGLDEEYALVTSNILPYHELKNDLLHKGEDFETTGIKDMRCNLDSIMCVRETIYPYHYNNILRRIPKQ